MTTTSKLLSVPAWLLILVLTSACHTWQQAQGTAEHSCLASIHKSIASLAQTEPIFITEVNSQWRALNDSELQQITSAISKLNSLDCGQKNPDNFLIDKWSKPLTIVVRRIPNEPLATSKNLEFMVWSNGRDGVAGTADDIVSPYGANLPPEILSPNK